MNSRHLDEQLRHGLRLARDRRQHRRVAAVIGDVAVLDAGRALADRLHHVVPGGGQAGGRDRHVLAAFLQRLEELAEILERGARVRGDGVHVGDGEEQVPVLELAVEEPEHLVAADVDRSARGPGVAVLGALEHALGADRARGAGLVHHDDLLLELGLELGRDDARHLVGRAAGGPGHDQRDRAVGLPRVVLGGGRAGEQSERRGGDGIEEAAHVSSLPALLTGRTLVAKTVRAPEARQE